VREATNCSVKNAHCSAEHMATGDVSRKIPFFLIGKYVDPNPVLMNIPKSTIGIRQLTEIHIEHSLISYHFRRPKR